MLGIEQKKYIVRNAGKFFLVLNGILVLAVIIIVVVRLL